MATRAYRLQQLTRILTRRFAMKISKFFAAVIAATLLFVGSASAATVGLGVLSDGDTGFVYGYGLGARGTYSDLVYGVLSANSSITFDLTVAVPPSRLNSFSGAFGQYSYSEKGMGDAVTKSVISNMQSAVPSVVPSDITKEVLNAAAPGWYNWTVTVANQSSDYMSFASYFKVLVANAKGGVYALAYSVTQTPIPSSVILFATGILVIAGMAMRKRSDGRVS